MQTSFSQPIYDYNTYYLSINQLHLLFHLDPRSKIQRGDPHMIEGQNWFQSRICEFGKYPHLHQPEHKQDLHSGHHSRHLEKHAEYTSHRMFWMSPPTFCELNERPWFCVVWFCDIGWKEYITSPLLQLAVNYAGNNRHFVSTLTWYTLDTRLLRLSPSNLDHLTFLPLSQCH